MRTSLISTPGKSRSSAVSASRAREKVRTWKPDSSSHCCTAWRIAASSSMKITCPLIACSSRSRRGSLLGGVRFGSRQRQSEHRAVLVVADFQRAAHLTDDAVGHREPKAEALADRFGGEEGLEHLIQMFAGNTALSPTLSCQRSPLS